MFEDYKTSQPIAYQILSNQIKNKKLSHAYIFDDNLQFATSLISRILDENNEDFTMSRIESRNHPDVIFISPIEGVIKKEQILQLQRDFSKCATESEFQIYIIEEADKMNVSASNTLLKFLEEPVDNVIAMLLTSSKNKLLSTIISRCQDITFTKSVELAFLYTLNDEVLFKDLNDFILNIENKTHIMKSSFDNYFLDKAKMVDIFDTIIYIYSVVMSQYNEKDEKLATLVQLIKKQNSIYNIKNKINILIEAKNNLSYNANMNLLFDKIYIKFGGI